MSTTTTEEDTELRDLVAATLENSGILGKIKAQLRANVYIALEEGENVKTKSKLVNQNLIDFLSTTNGRLVASLVREFLEFFDLDFTLAVFDPETNIGKDFKYRERSKLIDALGLTELTDKKSPLLSEIMRLSKVSVLKSESPTPTEVSIEDDQHTSAQTSLNEDLNSKSEMFDKSERSMPDKFDISDKASDKSGHSEISSHKSDKYSDDFSLHKQKSQTSDISDNSGSSTPEIPLKDQTLNLLGSKSGSRLGGLSSTFTLEKESDRKKASNLEADSLKAKDSFLTDLPPLGGLGKSSISDLPPLSMPGRGLAPLSKIPPKASDFGDIFSKKEPSSLPKPNEAIEDPPQIALKKQESSFAKKRSGAPSFGFEPDHVISEKSESVKKDAKKSPVSSPDITENIEEELDSFLNSEISGGDDITRDETFKDDASLKADYVESL
eukprot:TRINITY_DN30521_c0_g1_i1.p1 TRINITY_DN30521_c0_g1~~TRINITY_DN30521_c0_g1_i1.p1  ORF type:complete len:440 (+),score=169.83 TRINITY_DN30521_c0_g1_i1:53-1372(+)